MYVNVISCLTCATILDPHYDRHKFRTLHLTPPPTPKILFCMLTFSTFFYFLTFFYQELHEEPIAEKQHEQLYVIHYVEIWMYTIQNLEIFVFGNHSAHQTPPKQAKWDEICVEKGWVSVELSEQRHHQLAQSIKEKFGFTNPVPDDRKRHFLGCSKLYV